MIVGYHNPLEHPILDYFDPISFDILKKNTECEFNRLELEENIFELYPTGALIVRDLKDIVSFIANNKIVSIKLQFDDKTFISLSITSTTYVNNAASNTEENFVSINVSNSFYRYFSTNTLTQLMSGWGYNRPTVFSVDELVTLLKTKILN